jgi:hypothetical protein
MISAGMQTKKPPFGGFGQAAYRRFLNSFMMRHFT